MDSAVLLVSIYLVLMVAVGVWGMLRTKTLNDFFLGGRSFGPWVTAFAYGTSYFSAVVFIGFAGKFGWNNGLSSIWVGVGNALAGAFLAWLVLGRRTRRMTRALDVMTMPEFFFRRFDLYWLKPFAAMAIFIFLLPYSAGVYKGLAELFVAEFPSVPFETAILVMAVITGVYLILGGYFAVAITDCIQGVIMIGGVLVLIFYVSHAAAPAGGVLDAARAASERYAEHRVAGLANPGPWYLLPSIICMTSFGCWALPQMVHKFYAVRDEKAIMRGAFVCAAFALLIGCAAYYTGSLSHLFFDRLPEVAGGAAQDTLVPQILVAHLPKPLLGVILVLLLSASMSTLSGLVLVSASAVTIDLYKGIVDPEVSHRVSVTLMRFLCAIFIAISYFIATHRVAFIETLMSLSWGALSGAFLAPFIYALFWRRTTGRGVAAGMIVGLATSILTFFLFPKSLAATGACLAMALPFAVVPVVSLFTAPPPADLVARAFSSDEGSPLPPELGRAAR